MAVTSKDNALVPDTRITIPVFLRLLDARGNVLTAPATDYCEPHGPRIANIPFWTDIVQVLFLLEKRWREVGWRLLV